MKGQEQQQRTEGDELSLQVDLMLCQDMLAGDKDAGREMYERFHRMVGYFTMRLVQSTDLRAVIVDEDDVRQEGFVYLMEAAQRYKGEIPFGPYLSSYMRQNMRRKVDSQMHGVRVPYHLRDVQRSIEAIDTRRMSHGLGPASAEELAQEFNIPPHVVEELRELRMVRQYMGSLERGYSPRVDGDPGNNYVLDKTAALQPVTGEVPLGVEEQVEHTSLSEQLDAVLSVLSEREATVVRMRFGFGAEEAATLEEVGKVLNVTGERVRQLEKKAIEKLSHPSRSQELRAYLS